MVLLWSFIDLNDVASIYVVNHVININMRGNKELYVVLQQLIKYEWTKER